MRVYLCGPMTGIEEKNFPAFTQHAEDLRRAGYDVVSPHEEEPNIDALIPSGEEYDTVLKADLRHLLTCDAIVVMDGWTHSRGARLEVTTAINVGMRLLTFEEAYNMSYEIQNQGE